MNKHSFISGRPILFISSGELFGLFIKLYLLFNQKNKAVKMNSYEFIEGFNHFWVNSFLFGIFMIMFNVSTNTQENSDV